MPEKDNKFKIGIFDTSDAIDAQARDEAHAQILHEQAALSTGSWADFFQNVKRLNVRELGSNALKSTRRYIQYNLLGDLTHLRRQEQFKNQMRAHASIYSSGGRSVDRESRTAVADRLVSGALQQGEIVQDGIPNNFQQEIKALVRIYSTGASSDASGNISGGMRDADFEAQRELIIRRYAENHKGISQSDVMGLLSYSDNMLLVAKEVRQAVAHGEGLEALVDELQFVTGKARMGANTEANLKGIDKILAGMKKYRLGAYFANSKTVALATAFGYSVLAWSAKSVTRRVAGAVLTGAAAGGFMAQREEGIKLDEERRLVAREMAYGKTFADSASARRELASTVLRQESASYFTNSINELLYDGTGEGGRPKEKAGLTREDLGQAISVVSELEARIRIMDRKQVEGGPVDLIKYSRVENVEVEKNELYKLRMYARATITEALKSNRFSDQGQNFDVDQLQYKITGFDQDELASIIKFAIIEGHGDGKGTFNSLAQSLEELRISKGFMVHPIEAHMGGDETRKKAAYKRWIESQAKKLLRSVQLGKETIDLPRVDGDDNAKDRAVDEYMNRMSSFQESLVLVDDFGEEELKKDLYAKMRKSRGWKAFAVGAASATIIGGAISTATGWASGYFGGDEAVASGGTTMQLMAESGHTGSIALPGGVELRFAGLNGTKSAYDLLIDGKKVEEGLLVHETGRLTHETKDIMSEYGLEVKDTSKIVDIAPEESVVDDDSVSSNSGSLARSRIETASGSPAVEEADTVVTRGSAKNIVLEDNERPTTKDFVPKEDSWHRRVSPALAGDLDKAEDLRIAGNLEHGYNSPDSPHLPTHETTVTVGDRKVPATAFLDFLKGNTEAQEELGYMKITGREWGGNGTPMRWVRESGGGSVGGGEVVLKQVGSVQLMGEAPSGGGGVMRSGNVVLETDSGSGSSSGGGKMVHVGADDYERNLMDPAHSEKKVEFLLKREPGDRSWNSHNEVHPMEEAARGNAGMFFTFGTEGSSEGIYVPFDTVTGAGAVANISKDNPIYSILFDEHGKPTYKYAEAVVRGNDGRIFAVATDTIYGKRGLLPEINVETIEVPVEAPPQDEVETPVRVPREDTPQDEAPAPRPPLDSGDEDDREFDDELVPPSSVPPRFGTDNNTYVDRLPRDDGYILPIPIPFNPRRALEPADYGDAPVRTLGRPGDPKPPRGGQRAIAKGTRNDVKLLMEYKKPDPLAPKGRARRPQMEERRDGKRPQDEGGTEVRGTDELQREYPLLNDLAKIAKEKDQDISHVLLDVFVYGGDKSTVLKTELQKTEIGNSIIASLLQMAKYLKMSRFESEKKRDERSEILKRLHKEVSDATISLIEEITGDGASRQEADIDSHIRELGSLKLNAFRKIFKPPVRGDIALSAHGKRFFYMYTDSDNKKDQDKLNKDYQALFDSGAYGKKVTQQIDNVLKTVIGLNESLESLKNKADAPSRDRAREITARLDTSYKHLGSIVGGIVRDVDEANSKLGISKTSKRQDPDAPAVFQNYGKNVPRREPETLDEYVRQAMHETFQELKSGGRETEPPKAELGGFGELANKSSDNNDLGDQVYNIYRRGDSRAFEQLGSELDQLPEDSEHRQEINGIIVEMDKRYDDLARLRLDHAKQEKGSKEQEGIYGEILKVGARALELRTNLGLAVREMVTSEASKIPWVASPTHIADRKKGVRLKQEQVKDGVSSADDAIVSFLAHAARLGNSPDLSSINSKLVGRELVEMGTDFSDTNSAIALISTALKSSDDGKALVEMIKKAEGAKQGKDRDKQLVVIGTQFMELAEKKVKGLKDRLGSYKKRTPKDDEDTARREVPPLTPEDFGSPLKDEKKDNQQSKESKESRPVAVGLLGEAIAELKGDGTLANLEHGQIASAIARRIGMNLRAIDGDDDKTAFIKSLLKEKGAASILGLLESGASPLAIGNEVVKSALKIPRGNDMYRSVMEPDRVAGKELSRPYEGALVEKASTRTPRLIELVNEAVSKQSKDKPGRESINIAKRILSLGDDALLDEVRKLPEGDNLVELIGEAYDLREKIKNKLHKSGEGRDRNQTKIKYEELLARIGRRIKVGAKPDMQPTSGRALPRTPKKRSQENMDTNAEMDTSIGGENVGVDADQSAGPEYLPRSKGVLKDEKRRDFFLKRINGVLKERGRGTSDAGLGALVLEQLSQNRNLMSPLFAVLSRRLPPSLAGKLKGKIDGDNKELSDSDVAKVGYVVRQELVSESGALVSYEIIQKAIKDISRVVQSTERDGQGETDALVDEKVGEAVIEVAAKSDANTEAAVEAVVATASNARDRNAKALEKLMRDRIKIRRERFRTPLRQSAADRILLRRLGKAVRKNKKARK